MREPKPTYDGPPILSIGFRPFFLAASLFALGAVPIWILAWGGRLTLGGPSSRPTGTSTR